MAVGGLNTAIPNIAPVGGTQSSQATGATQGNRDEFRNALNGFGGTELTKQPLPSTPLKFSNHAIERMQLRGVKFDPAQLAKIDQAIDKAASKGAKNTLLLTDASALIVSVKDRTVVTVMDKGGMKDNVFTNIDSTVVI